MDDSELHPPDVELAEAVDPDRREGGAVVGTDGLGDSDLLEEPSERCLCPLRAHRGEGFAEQEHAAVVVGDGERIAVLAITGPEMALEVGGPDLVRCVRFECNRSGMLPAPAAPVLAELAVAIQHSVDGTPGRKVASQRMSSLEDLEKLLGAPAVLRAQGQDLPLDGLGGSIGVHRGRPRSVFGALSALMPDPLDPLVAGGPGDPIAAAQLAHRPLATLVVAMKLLTLFLGVRLHPGQLLGVNDVPGLL